MFEALPGGMHPICCCVGHLPHVPVQANSETGPNEITVKLCLIMMCPLLTAPKKTICTKMLYESHCFPRVNGFLCPFTKSPHHSLPDGSEYFFSQYIVIVFQRSKAASRDDTKHGTDRRLSIPSRTRVHLRHRPSLLLRRCSVLVRGSFCSGKSPVDMFFFHEQEINVRLTSCNSLWGYHFHKKYF